MPALTEAASLKVHSVSSKMDVDCNSDGCCTPIAESWQEECYSACEYPLHWAAQNGGPDEIYRLIDLGMNLENIDYQGKTAVFYTVPLICNIYHNYVSKYIRYEEVIALLSNENLDLDYSGKCDPIAIKENKPSHYDNLRAFVISGANTNATDMFGSTLLHITALCGDIEAAQLLVESGCNVNAVDKWCRRPISNAIESNNLEMVEFLIEAGADISNLNSSIALAIRNNYQNVLNVVLRNVDHIPYDCFFAEITKYVCCRGFHKTLSILLQKGFDVNMRDASKMSLLDYSVERNQYEIATLLIHNGASVLNDPKENGYTTLHRAIHLGNQNIVQLLLIHGADLHLLLRMKVLPRDTDSKLAMSTNSFNFFKFIVYNGANVRALDTAGNSLLHVLARELKTGCYYATIEKRNYNLTKNEKQLNVVKQRREVKQVEEFVTFLLRNGLSINDEDHTGCTAFQHAVLFNPNFTYVIIKNIVKLLEKKRFIQDNIVKLLHCTPKFSVFHDECKAELSRMKSAVIDDTNISLYDIVCGKNEDQLMYCSENEKVTSSLRTNEYELWFPLYYNDLEIHIKEGKERRHLYENGAMAISHLHNRGLPDLVTNKMLSYLSIKDIKNLVKSVDGSFKFYDRLKP